MTTEREFPIQGVESYTGQPVRITWDMAEEIYKEYSAQFSGQTLERLAERGGFGVYEAISLLCQRIKRIEGRK